MNRSPSTRFLPLKPISSGHCLFGNVWFFGASPMKIYCEPSLPCKRLYGRRGSSRRNPGNVSKPDKSNSVWMLFAIGLRENTPKKWRKYKLKCNIRWFNKGYNGYIDRNWIVWFMCKMKKHPKPYNVLIYLISWFGNSNSTTQVCKNRVWPLGPFPRYFGRESDRNVRLSNLLATFGGGSDALVSWECTAMFPILGCPVGS